MSFKHGLGQTVKISVSGEMGHVKGRAEYLNNCPAYLIHYRAADGRGEGNALGLCTVDPGLPVSYGEIFNV